MTIHEGEKEKRKESYIYFSRLHSLANKILFLLEHVHNLTKKPIINVARDNFFCVCG